MDLKQHRIDNPHMYSKGSNKKQDAKKTNGTCPQSKKTRQSEIASVLREEFKKRDEHSSSFEQFREQIKKAGVASVASNKPTDPRIAARLAAVDGDGNDEGLRSLLERMQAAGKS